MVHHVSALKLLPSICFGFLTLGSGLMFLPSTIVNPQPLAAQQSNQLPNAKAIAEQVRHDAIVQEKLEKTAKIIQIERVGTEIWMYNPVPYWKITIADSHHRLVYFTNDNGKFRVVMQRNGQPTHPMGQTSREVLPPGMVTEVIRKAKEWGYLGQLSPTALSAEKTTWASGCENISAPFACDRIAHNGWKITAPFQGINWVFRGEGVGDLQLIERSNLAIEGRLPTKVLSEVKRIAGKHTQLSPATILITKIELLTFSDSCLGLGNLAESCAQQTIRGYRVTVTGHPKEQQIYRMSNDTKYRRTESNAGLPVRTDELPTAIARKVFNTAQVDLKQSIGNLRINRVEATFVCFRMPTASPTEPCLPTTTVNGWNVTVTNYQKSRTYTVDLNGKILRKR